jgi:hypothetical protein
MARHRHCRAWMMGAVTFDGKFLPYDWTAAGD